MTLTAIRWNFNEDAASLVWPGLTDGTRVYPGTPRVLIDELTLGKVLEHYRQTEVTFTADSNGGPWSYAEDGPDDEEPERIAIGNPFPRVDFPNHPGLVDLSGYVVDIVE